MTANPLEPLADDQKPPANDSTDDKENEIPNLIRIETPARDKRKNLNHLIFGGESNIVSNYLGSFGQSRDETTDQSGFGDKSSNKKRKAQRNPKSKTHVQPRQSQGQRKWPRNPARNCQGRNLNKEVGELWVEKVIKESNGKRYRVAADDQIITDWSTKSGGSGSKIGQKEAKSVAEAAEKAPKSEGVSLDSGPKIEKLDFKIQQTD